MEEMNYEKELLALKVGEKYRPNSLTEILCVPTGWIFTIKTSRPSKAPLGFETAFVTSTFVPKMECFQNKNSNNLAKTIGSRRRN